MELILVMAADTIFLGSEWYFLLTTAAMFGFHAMDVIKNDKVS